MAVKLHADLAVHAGEWLQRNVVEIYGLSVSEMAAHLRVSRPVMKNLLSGQAGLSAAMAIRFEKAFGLSAETMMEMQTAFELAQARKTVDLTDIERCEPPS